jgi:signal recognition particle GTPase
MFQQLSDRLNNTFKALKSKGRLSETDINDTVKEIRTALLDADVALAVANSFSEKIREKASSDFGGTGIQHRERSCDDRIFGSASSNRRFKKSSRLGSRKSSISSSIA